MKWKKFLQQFGGLFAVSYVAAFFLLVTFYSRLKIATVWGDVLIIRPESEIYLPFGMSALFALFITAFFEGYKMTRH
ncbi:hypothetical protein C4564_04005 [Candidatus Microgenomates bacterium]|nr:MAG: hypothetical protein C4564_04005 [Candidatus Microgenomates bacterium]